MRISPHICTLKEANSGSCLPPSPSDASWFQKRWRDFRKWFLPSDRDPRIIEYYRTSYGLQKERRRQIESGHSFVIHPFSSLKHAHEVVMAITFFTLLTDVPFNILLAESLYCWIHVLNAICMIDILLRFFMGYVDPKTKTVELKLKKIAKNYVTSLIFYVDVISSMPFDYKLIRFFGSKEIGDMYFLKFFKIFRVHTIFTYLNRIALLLNVNKTFYMIFKSFLVFLLMSVWGIFAVLYWPYFKMRWLGGDINSSTWLMQGKFYETQTLTSCIQAWFYVSGIAYGSFHNIHYNQAWDEVMLAIVILLIGKMCTALLAVIIIAHLNKKYTLDTKYQEIINQLEQYMTQRRFPKSTRERLINYYEYKYQKKYFKEKVITSILSENIRKEVNINICKQLVLTVDLFTRIPQKIISDILGHLKMDIYLPNDVIIKAGTVGDCMYFLSSGTVAVYTPSGKEICHLEEGAYFGEIAMVIKDQKRTADVVAIEVCEVLRLEKKAFRAHFVRTKIAVLQMMQKVAEARMQKTATLENDYKFELFQKAFSTDKP